MRIAAQIGLWLLMVHEPILVSCQNSNLAISVAPTQGDEMPTMDGLMTVLPTEGDSLLESQAPSDTTSAPSEELTKATISPSLRGTNEGSVEDEEEETTTPTMDESMSETLMEVEVGLDEGATNFTEFDELEQVPVGTTDEVATEMPTETVAPAEDESDAPTDETETTGMPMEDTETTAPTESPSISTDTDTATTSTEPPATGLTDTDTSAPATQCAVQVFNTDPVCGQLLTSTNAECDCYNFCSGKLIACLKYGERNSFSCSGETVAGCTVAQMVVSAAPQRWRTLSAIFLVVLSAISIV